ncbi:MAG: hypothetical protein K2N05_04380 [Muribaculaceae bacterium]|nr:hypothetical protein [Muribaculaceae bacterium]
MKLTSFFRHITLSLFPFLGLLAGGCASEKEYPGSDRNGEVDMELSVNVLSAGSDATRASTPVFSVPDFPSENLNSLRVLIIDKVSSEVKHNRTVLFENGIPQAADMIFRLKSASQYIVYLMGNCQFMDYDLDIDHYPIGSKYSPDDERSLENRILYASSDGTLFNNSDKNKPGLDIPMLERFEITTIPAEDGMTKRQHTDLFITRSAAKFSFNISTSQDFKGVAGKKLTTIKITGISDRQHLLPTRTVYAPEKDKPGIGVEGGRDITSFAIPENVNVNEFIYTLPEPLDLPTSGFEWNPEIYLPESILPEGGFSCSLSFDNGESWLIPVTLPNLPYGLPRNTHAKVNITIGNENALIASVTVLPWKKESVDFDYSDHVGMAADGALNFTAGSYLSFDKSTARLVLKNQAGAKGSFGISTPLGARWDAYLITQNGEPDVIRFRLEDGSTTTHLSGNINGTKTDFMILSTVAPGKVANTARLQVIVTTLDGRSIPVNILQGGGYGPGIENLTIIQNPK